MGGSEGLRWPLQVPAPHPRLKRNHRGAADSPGHLAPRQDKHRVSLSSSGGLTHPPGRLGFGGIESLSLLGAKAKDLGQVDCWTRARKQPRPAICAQCPVGPFPGAAPFPPRGSLTCLL